MNNFVLTLHSGAGWIVDRILYLFSDNYPRLGLVVISALSGVALLYLYGKVSNQRELVRVKQKIYSAVLESVLFRHDVRLSLRAQGRLFFCGLQYFALAVPPLVILAIPGILLMAQINLWYGGRGLQSGETAMLNVQLKDPRLLRQIQIKSSGVEVSPPVRIIDSGEAFWRIKHGEGAAPNQELAAGMGIQLELGEQRMQWPIFSENFFGRLTHSASFLPVSSFLSPGPKLPEAWGSVVRKIEIVYPERKFGFMGWRLHWMVVFLVVSMASGMIAARMLKIQI